MASIYNIPDWNDPTDSTYVENDIVKHSGYFWYALKDVPAGTAPALPSLYWGGVWTAAKTTHSLPPRRDQA